MANLELSVSLIPSPLTEPVLSGQAPVANVSVQAHEARSVNTNSVEMLDLTYDVGEMSLATYTKAREQGVPLVALPIFTGRRFLHGAVMLAPDCDIADLSELRGKRVGLPQFWMTSSVWHRLVLHREYRVAQNEVHWVTQAPERMGALGLPPEARQDTSGRSPRDLLLAGEIDAQMGPGVGGEGRAEASGGPQLGRAFADSVAAQRDYYQRTHVFPVMHLIVMKDNLAQGHSGLVESLCGAFEEAKRRNLSTALDTPSFRPIPGLERAEIESLFGADPWAYGITPNRLVLETFLDDVLEQGLIDRPMDPEDLFPSELPADLR